MNGLLTDQSLLVAGFSNLAEDVNSDPIAATACALFAMFGEAAIEVASSQVLLATDDNQVMWQAVVMALTKQS